MTADYSALLDRITFERTAQVGDDDKPRQSVNSSGYTGPRTQQPRLTTRRLWYLCIALMMEAVRTSNLSLNFNVTRRYYIPEDSKLLTDRLVIW